MELGEQVGRAYGMTVAECSTAHAFVNDVARVRTATDDYALKLYRAGLRTRGEVEWEVALVRHLAASGVPVCAPLPGRDGYVHTLVVDGHERLAVLSPWAPGAKPPPSTATYLRLGRTAAALHAAADTFASSRPRPAADEAATIDRPLALLRPHLDALGRWEDVRALAERFRAHLRTTALDRGICHGDLTLDNVHADGDTTVVFDVDSACRGWRAAEGSGVLAYARQSDPGYWTAWLAGYRSVRPFSAADEAATAWFGIDLANTAWRLGLTPASVGRLLTPEQLATAVDGWLAPEQERLRG